MTSIFLWHAENHFVFDKDTLFWAEGQKVKNKIDKFKLWSKKKFFKIKSHSDLQ